MDTPAPGALLAQHVPVSTDAPDVDKPGVYKVGTLTYTLGSLSVLFAFLMLGDFAYAIRERAVGDIFQVLLRKFAVSDLLFSILTSTLPAIMTIMVVPFIGVISDNYRSRLGRRIPFLIITTPIIAIAIACLAVAPQIGIWLAPAFGGGEEGVRLASIATLSLCWTLFEAGALVANAIFSSLVNDVVPAKVIGRFYGMFRIFSLLAGILFNYYLFKFANDWYSAMFLAIAAIYGVAFGVMCWRVKEGSYPPPPRPVQATSLAHNIGTYAKASLGVPFFALLIVVYSLAMGASVAINAVSLKSAQAFGLDDAGYGNARAITYTISLLLAFPLGWISDVLHPMRTAFAATALYAIVMLTGWLLIHDAQTFQVFFILHGVLSGVFFTTVLSLLPRLLPRERFTQIFAAALVFQCILTAVVSVGIGKALDGLLNHDYRMTFLISGAIALVAGALWVVLYRQFQVLGGLKAYQPPRS
jgi:MFS family permease